MHNYNTKQSYEKRLPKSGIEGVTSLGNFCFFLDSFFCDNYLLQFWRQAIFSRMLFFSYKMSINSVHGRVLSSTLNILEHLLNLWFQQEYLCLPYIREHNEMSTLN